MNARLAAIVLGVVLTLVGILGFFPNPIADASGNALFNVNIPHTIVHLVSGLFLLAGAWTALGSVMALRILGIVYVVVAVLGFIMPDAILGFISNSPSDNWLHVALAIVLLGAGFGLTDDEPAAMSSRM